MTVPTTPALIEETAGPIALVPGKHGLFAVNINDAYVGTSLMTYGEFSDAEVDLLATCPTRNVLVEVGANIGALTIPLARHFGTVVAIEPQRLVWQPLVANVALNDRRNVIVRQIACGNAAQAEAGAIAVPALAWDRPNNFGGLSLGGPLPDDVPTERVPVFMLDDVVQRADVVKLDCEGMERDVLEGADLLLSTSAPILYVENDREAKSAALIALLREHDYRLWWHRPPLFNPANAAGESANIFDAIVSHNMLCVPMESEWVPDVERFGLTPVEE